MTALDFVARRTLGGRVSRGELSVGEAAAMAGVTDRTVRTWRQEYDESEQVQPEIEPQVDAGRPPTPKADHDTEGAAERVRRALALAGEVDTFEPAETPSSGDSFEPPSSRNAQLGQIIEALAVAAVEGASAVIGQALRIDADTVRQVCRVSASERALIAELAPSAEPAARAWLGAHAADSAKPLALVVVLLVAVRAFGSVQARRRGAAELVTVRQECAELRGSLTAERASRIETLRRCAELEQSVEDLTTEANSEPENDS